MLFFYNTYKWSFACSGWNLICHFLCISGRSFAVREQYRQRALHWSGWLWCCLGNSDGSPRAKCEFIYIHESTTIFHLLSLQKKSITVRKPLKKKEEKKIKILCVYILNMYVYIIYIDHLLLSWFSTHTVYLFIKMIFNWLFLHHLVGLIRFCSDRISLKFGSCIN